MATPRRCTSLRRTVLVPAMMLLLAVAVIVVLDGSLAQTEPPASGDWTVSDVTVIENRTVDLRGNLTVTSDGSLTLRNTTLRIHSTASVDRGILVEDGGTLHVGDWDQDITTDDDMSVIARGVPSLGYFFVVGSDARQLSITSSIVDSPGARTRSGGVLIRCDWVNLRHSTFTNGVEYNVKVEGANGTRIRSCEFLGSREGLVLKDARNVTVTWCNFTKSGTVGMRLDNATSALVRLCTVDDGTNTGVILRGCRDLRLDHLYVQETPWGVRLEDVSNLTMADSVVNETTFNGITVEGSSENITLDGCQVYNIGRSAIDVETVSNLTMDGCHISNASYYGFRLENGTRDIAVRNCGIRFCGYDGIKMAGVVNVTLQLNMVYHNGYNGIFLVDSADVLVFRNYINENGYDGVNLDSVRESVVDFNSLYENGYHGMNLQAGSNNITIKRNVARNNTRCGLGLDSVHNITLEHNELSFNGEFGMWVEASSHDIVGCNTALRRNAGGAVRVESSWDVWLTTTTVVQPPTPAYGLYVRSSWDVWLVDSQVRGTAHVSRGGMATIVSPVEEGAFTPDVEDTSWLDLAYWVQVEVVWPDTLPVDGAYVNATATGGRVLMEARTHADGITDTLPVTITRYTASAVVPTNPMTFRARKGNVWAHNTTTVANDTRVHIVLQDSIHPIAVAPNVTAELGTKTMLDGRGSWDNGEVISWLWTFDDGVGTVVFDGSTVNWTFTVLGNFTGRLEVADLVGLTNVTTYRIRVVDTTSPVVVAGENLTVDQHTQVVLDGRNTTDNDATLLATGGFVWSVYVEGEEQAPIAVRQGSMETYTFDDMGRYIVRLVVTDQSGNDGGDDFLVEVRDTTPPVVVLGDDREVAQGTIVMVIPEKVGDNDPALDVLNDTEWRVVGPGLDIVQNGPTLRMVVEEMGTYRVWLNVTDPSGNVGGDAMTVTSLDTEPPSLPVEEDRTVETGSEVHLDASAVTDNDPAFPEDALFRWSVDGPEGRQDMNGVTAFFVPRWIGDYVVTLNVTDAAGNSADASFTVMTIDTSYPAFTLFLPEPENLSNSTEVQITIAAMDHGTGVDLDRVHVRFKGPGAEEWSEWERVELSGSSSSLWAHLDLTFEEGTTLVQVRIYDRAGNGPVLSAEHPVRVNARPRAVILTPAEGAKYGVHDEIILDASASSDPDNDTLYFRWESDRDGLLGSEARVRAPPLAPGEHRLTVTVLDGVEGHEVYAHVTITVLPEPSVVDEDDGSPWILWALLLVLAAVGCLLAWETWFRRRGPPSDDVADGPGAIDGASEWEQVDRR